MNLKKKDKREEDKNWMAFSIKFEIHFSFIAINLWVHFLNTIDTALMSRVQIVLEQS